MGEGADTPHPFELAVIRTLLSRKGKGRNNRIGARCTICDAVKLKHFPKWLSCPGAAYACSTVPHSSDGVARDSEG
jgi:hypothetical protein